MPSHYDEPAGGEQDYSPPRRLPPLPRTTPRPTSRPLPSVPRPLACKLCRTRITSSHALFPRSSCPPDVRLFKGFSGEASLFTETYNVRLSAPGVQLMATGAHTMQEISCSSCSTYLGWKIVRAHETSEKWKEGACLLELEHLYYSLHEPTFPPTFRGMSPDSDSDQSSYSLDVQS